MPTTKRTSRRLADNAKERSTVTPSPKSLNTDDEDDTTSKSYSCDEPLVTVKRQETKPMAKRKKGRAVATSSSKNEPDIISDSGHNEENSSVKRVSKRIKKNESDLCTGKKNIMTILQNDANAFRVEAASMAKRNSKQSNVAPMLDNNDKEAEDMTCVPCATGISNTSVADGVDSNAMDDKIDVDESNMNDDADRSEDNNNNNDDDDDEDDRPFTVEYATSSRATCRRCDAVIGKGEIRISHVPLFRGKPGYRVYRHLHCAVFSEEITNVPDVGGWKKLKSADVEQLRQRIEESQIEIVRENEDLDPDELVQKGFQGEIRKTPTGFLGTQLPFQIEGQSWMYHQEVHVPEIRGGILADEMGMVRFVVM